jgi:hypothetical protein
MVQTATQIFGLALEMSRASAPRIQQAQKGPYGSRATVAE